MCIFFMIFFQNMDNFAITPSDFGENKIYPFYFVLGKMNNREILNFKSDLDIIATIELCGINSVGYYGLIFYKKDSLFFVSDGCNSFLIDNEDDFFNNVCNEMDQFEDLHWFITPISDGSVLFASVRCGSHIRKVALYPAFYHKDFLSEDMNLDKFFLNYIYLFREEHQNP